MIPRRGFLAALAGLIGFGLAPKQTPVVKAMVPEYGETYIYELDGKPIVNSLGEPVWTVAERINGKWFITTKFFS